MTIDSLFNFDDQLKINEVNSVLIRFKLYNAYQTIKELQQCLKSFKGNLFGAKSFSFFRSLICTLIFLCSSRNSHL